MLNFNTNDHKDDNKHINYYPLTKVSNDTFIEGYWHNRQLDNSGNPIYPFPLATETKVDPQFLTKLQHVIMKKASVDYYFGYSRCRLCDNDRNGNSEYNINNGTLTFQFPSGLLHYYIDHNVQPSDEFYEFVMSYE